MTHNPGEYELDIIGIFNRSADIGQHWGCLSGIFGSDWSVVALRGHNDAKLGISSLPMATCQ